jgi:uncharacterized protein YndB with AHSA1/START domain
MPKCEIDLRPGGEWNYVFRFPDGNNHDCQAIYRVVEPPTKLVMESSVPGPNGQIFFSIRQTIFFEVRGAETELTLEMKVLRVNAGGEPFLEGAKQGFGMTMDNLEEYLDR